MSQRLRQVTHDKTMDTCEMVQPVEMDAASSEQNEDSKLKMLFAAWPKSGREARIIGYPFSTHLLGKGRGLTAASGPHFRLHFCNPHDYFQGWFGVYV